MVCIHLIIHINLLILYIYLYYTCIEYLNKTIRAIWTKKGAGDSETEDEKLGQEFDQNYDHYNEIFIYYKSQIRLLINVFLKRHPIIVITELSNRLYYLLNIECYNMNNYYPTTNTTTTTTGNNSASSTNNSNSNTTSSGIIYKERSMLYRGLESLPPIFDECIKFICSILYPIHNIPLPDTHIKKGMSICIT